MAIEHSIDPRDHLAIALDVGGLEAAEQLAKQVQPWIGIAKVGMELYAEAGPEAFAVFKSLGFKVFADMKLHDIPNTVQRSARIHARAGIDWLNFHAAGGVDMMRAALEGLHEGANDAGLPAPLGLAVTVLTSDADTSAFDQRLSDAITAKCDGVVCSGQEVEAVKTRQPDFGTMVPGIRLPDGETHDQARVATPDGAIKAGADWLVIGRAVSAAPDPAAAAAKIHDLVQAAISSRA